MLGRVGAALLLGGVMLLGGATAAVAAPIVAVSPLLAPVGASVSVTGTGCVGPVDVDVVAWGFPGPPFTVVETTVTPSGGAWSLTFPMPSAPAYVDAVCDGVPAATTVVSPNDVTVGQLATTEVTATEVVIRTSPLIEGSVIRALSASGAVLDIGTVSGGEGEVRVQRSLGPAVFYVLALRAPDPVIPLPYIPLANTVQLPLPTDATLTVAPRVSSAGTNVVARGTGCAGSGRLTVVGQASDWYEVPPVFVDRTLPVSSGAWSTTFPMPGEPSTVTLTCSAGGVTSQQVVVISASESGVLEVLPEVSEAGARVSLTGSAGALEAFTESGQRVAFRLVPGTVDVILSPTVTGRVVFVGYTAFGENAGANQTEGTFAWAVDLGDPAPSPSPSSTTDEQDGNASVSDDELADSGPVRLPLATGLVCVAVGLLLVTLSRRAPNRRPEAE